MSQTPNQTASFHPNVKDITGQKFGYLTVLRKSHKDIHRNIHWLCRCECGIEKSVNGLGLRQGKIKSCGCKSAEMTSKKNTRHGEAGTRSGGVKSRTYSCWMNARARASSNKTLAARKYAKRDITMDEKWITYEGFLEDMGHCPSDLHSLDRINNEFGYSKENCRWATQKEQQRNKSSNRLVVFEGKTMCVAEFAETIGMPYRIVADRIRSGWDVDHIAKTIPKRTQSASAQTQEQ